MKVHEERILETAYRIFRQRGIRSTDLQQVAKACGIETRELKLLYNSKKELVLAVVRHAMDKKTAHLLINTSLSPSAVTELNTFFRFVEDSIGALGAEIFAELKRYNPIALDQLEEIVNSKLIPCLQKIILRGITEGFYREDMEADLYASTYFHILRTILESDRDWDYARRTIAHIHTIFLHGALNAKGMRVWNEPSYFM